MMVGMTNSETESIESSGQDKIYSPLENQNMLLTKQREDNIKLTDR